MKKIVTADLAGVKLAKPAQRALEQAGIGSLRKLSTFTKAELEALHGIGPNAVTALTAALTQSGLSFSDNRKRKK